MSHVASSLLVAVCGLPMPRKDHATVMARFASDCLDKMNNLSHELETQVSLFSLVAENPT